MDIKKLNPWNWFHHEEEQTRKVQVKQSVPQIHSPLMQLHRDIDRMFSSLFQDIGWDHLTDTSGGLLRPNVDVASTDSEYHITVEVPGVDEKDLKLELAHDGQLVICGEKRQEKEQKDRNYYRVERSYGSFQRTLSLPEDANKENINASFKNGVLTITCPRKVISQSPVKVIEIKRTA